MVKLKTYLFLFLFLIVLPGGSWLYLKKGFNYRKQIIQELSNKTPLNDTLYTADSMVISNKGKCTVVSLNDDEKTLHDIYRQFKEARGFQLIAQSNAEIFKQEYKRTNPEIESLISKSYKQINQDQLKKLQSRFQGKDFIIIDSLSQIRNTYTKSEITKLINHIPPLLPYFDEKKMK